VAEVHQQILDFGVETARVLANDKHERKLVETAYSVLSDETFSMNILHSGFAMTALPHRSPQTPVWERIGGPNGDIRLHIESGRLEDQSMVGIPYGSMARLILIYLSTEAVRNNTRTVELGRTLNAFMQRMEISRGGQSRVMIRDQSRRLSLCRLTFFSRQAKQTLISSGSFIRNTAISNDEADNAGAAWQDTVELDETFYNSLKEHPLPLREAAIKQLSGQSLGLDLYMFLAYRLHHIQRATPVSWGALHAQFGAAVRERYVFKREIQQPLALALAAYPEARVDIERDGIIMHPSDSPVPKVFPRTASRIMQA
jgi:hypothetical protein